VSAFTVLFLPGQGAQHVGMGADVADAHPAAAEVFSAAGRALGYDLLRTCREGPATELTRTDVQQPAILATSAAFVEALRASGRLPDGALGGAIGLSLGEFTALWAAGALSLADALVLVRERGLGMQEASAAVPSGMSALRCEEPAAAAACAKAVARTGGVCVVANLNAPGQVVISGEKASLARASERLLASGAKRVLPLKVAGAFHSPVMEPAAARLAVELERTPFRDPRIPVVSNVTAAPVTTAAEARATLARQITSPVLLEASLRSLVEKGVRSFVEPGPGATLAGFVRKIDRALDVKGYDKVADLGGAADGGPGAGDTKGAAR
jgi:[acyl-carrier-protein] S-malonyltransferase